MYRMGQDEIDAVAELVKSGKLFRYMPDGQCQRFEQRYAKFVGVKHAGLTSSGTAALTAALSGLGIGPGDEVIVPAHTYMATAIAVLAAGAIPVIVDVDESITIDPDAVDDAVGPQTRAVIPVHMWGQVCDMDRIMRIARKRRLLVIEDACQSVGGGYEGKMTGAIGHAGAFSFNYFKNMSCGEGGAVVTNDSRAFQRMQCAVDCCRFYWKGREDDFTGFAASGSRASEFEGAILNVQLDRLPEMIREMRKQKKTILRQTRSTGLKPAPVHSLDWECGTYTMFNLPTAPQAQELATAVGGAICGKTGRHTYNEWDPILRHEGHAHPALNPYRMPQNRKCRKKYSLDMCSRSLEILNRTVMIANHPDRGKEQVSELVEKIKTAAEQVLDREAVGK